MAGKGAKKKVSTKRVENRQDTEVVTETAPGDLATESKQTPKRKVGANVQQNNVVTQNKSKPKAKRNLSEAITVGSDAQAGCSNADEPSAPKRKKRIKMIEESAAAAVQSNTNADEMLALEVSRRAERQAFPMDGDLSEEDLNPPEDESEGDSDSPPELLDDSEEESDIEEGEVNEDEEVDEEISFPSSQNNNAHIIETDKTRADEVFEKHELDSMAKFAKYL